MKKDIVNTNDKGQLHGIQIGYHSNGKIAYKENYINGNKHGDHIGYYSNGKIIHKKIYINGEQVSQEEWLAYERRSKLE
jgi:antitoxin component YwqK of YwqJK toxin-antitoxin module